MTDRVILHVGGPKSGTTYLQSVLAQNDDLLLQNGIRVVGPRIDLVHAAMVLRDDPRLGALPNAARSAWSRVVDGIRESPAPVAVVSYELLAGVAADRAAAAVADLAGLDVHIVITAREFGGAVPSAWQERLKFALTTPLEEWTPRDEDGGPRVEWGWRTMDPANVAARWAAAVPADHVHVVTVPRPDAAPGELWRRFAEACMIEVPGLGLEVDTRNESLGPAAAEILRRVNVSVGAAFDGNREHARWLRDTLAHRILVPLGGGRIGMTDAQFADAHDRSIQSVQRLRDGGYAVHGDLDDLVAHRRSGPTPGEIPATELLTTATQALGALLLLMRSEAPPAPEQNPGKIARLVRGTSIRLVGLRLDAFGKRMDELERAVQRERRLHQRVAELEDLVAELLLPGIDRDGDVLEAAIRRYRKESL